MISWTYPSKFKTSALQEPSSKTWKKKQTKQKPYTLGENIKDLYVEYIKFYNSTKRQLDLKIDKWFE